MKIYPKKIIIVLICVIIICTAAIVFFYLPKTGPPEITLLETASSVSINPNTYVPEIFFNTGEKVWVYMEYRNISHNGASNFTIILNVSHIDGEILGSVEDHIIKSEKACFYYFNTTESWPVGIYIVSSTLRDNLSGKTAVKSTDFNLV
jgi:hypothetical protein